MSDRSRPIRILHVVGGMNRGGVETGLIHVLRHIDRERYQMDFLVHTDQPCAYDEEVRALGSRIIPCLRPDQPWRYACNLLRALRDDGPYDVVHSHVHHFSGFVLMLARLAGVPIRIADSHSDTPLVDRRSGLLRRLYLQSMQAAIKAHATHGLASSQAAATALFGSRWQQDPRFRVLYQGIDLQPFREAQNTDFRKVRQELGLPLEALVIGHAGRFAEPKNHAFLVKVFTEVARREPTAHLLLVGDGPLRPTIEAQVRSLGLERRVVFAGVRADVPRLMVGAMDAFLFPSLWEGLGRVFLEAQAAGLRCLISEAVPEEATVIPALVRRLSLSLPPEEWASVLLDRTWGSDVSREEALSLMESSRFNITFSVRRLVELYGA